MEWDDVIEILVDHIDETTGIPVDKTAFTFHEDFPNVMVLFHGNELGIFEYIEDESYMADSIIEAMGNIKERLVGARMSIMERRLEEFSEVAMKALEAAGIGQDILDDTYFEIEDVGHAMTHYDQSDRGYPKIALVASYDMVRAMTVLDYNEEPPYNMDALVQDFKEQLEEELG